MMKLVEITNKNKKRGERPDYLPIVFTAAIGGLIYGYDSGINYGYILPNLNELEHIVDKEQLQFLGRASIDVTGFLPCIVMSIMTIGEPCNVIAKSETTFFICGNLFILGSVIGAAAFHSWMVVAARVFMLFGIGATLHSSPIYIAEVSLHKLRGVFVSMFYLFVAGGQLLAYLVSKMLSNVPDGWRGMLAIGGVIALVQFHLAKSIFPETHSKSYIDVLTIGGITISNDPEHFTDAPSALVPSLFCIGCILAQQLVGVHTVVHSSPRILQLAGYTAENLYSLVIPCYSALGCLVTYQFC